MAKEKLDEIEKKKKELEAELERIQHDLDESLDEVRTDVTSRLDPVEFVKRNPLPVVGASLLIGFFAGYRGRSSKRSTSSDEGFSDVLWSELKKLATRKAVSYATDVLDDLLSEKNEPSSTLTNGSASKKE